MARVAAWAEPFAREPPRRRKRSNAGFAVPVARSSAWNADSDRGRAVRGERRIPSECIEFRRFFGLTCRSFQTRPPPCLLSECASGQWVVVECSGRRTPGKCLFGITSPILMLHFSQPLPVEEPSERLGRLDSLSSARLCATRRYQMTADRHNLMIMSGSNSNESIHEPSAALKPPADTIM
jgi:hypothetical protein